MSSSVRAVQDVALPGLRRALRFVALLLVASAALAQGGSGDVSQLPDRTYRRVLILSSFASDFAFFNEIRSILKTEIARKWSEPVDVYEIPLDLVRFADSARQAPYVEYLATLFGSRRLDLVVTLGGPASLFVQSHRTELYSDVPVLHAALDARLIDPARLGASDATVAITNDLTAPVETLLQLLPATENLAVVMGSSALEMYWRRELARELARYEDRLHLIWLDGMSLAEIGERVANLPPHSAVYFGLMLIDAAGVPYAQDRALAAIRSTTNAPIFGLYDDQIGMGVVGGRLMPVSQVGSRVAEAAMRLLAGEPPTSVRYPPFQPTESVFDGRELRRWGIPIGRLPAESRVSNEPRSAWSIFRWQILGGLALVGLQFALIVGLVAQRNRRRAAELEVRALHGSLLTTYEQERGRLARELHDDVTQRLARLAIDAAHLERQRSVADDEGISTQMRRDLVRLTDDVQALSRRLHPTVLYDLGLPEALRSEAERFSADHSLVVERRLDDAPSGLSPEVALCLYRVAQESLRNVARHAQASRVEISLSRQRDNVELSVRDDGRGFSPEAARAGGGLGLISLRERLHLVGGRLTVISAPGRGTTVLAWAPIGKETS